MGEAFRVGTNTFFPFVLFFPLLPLTYQPTGPILFNTSLS